MGLNAQPGDYMSQDPTSNKTTPRDWGIAHAWTWFPWLSFALISLPLPIILLILFFTAATTEAAAILLFFTLFAAAIGFGAALLFLLFLLFYRKRWFSKFRDKLAADGITASEVPWFESELTTAERKSLRQIKARSPLLADAYSETLAARLIATRILNRTKKELLVVERRLNRVAMIQAADTRVLQQDLQEDRARLERVKNEATSRFAETQARLQMIEAAASRDLGHYETYAMLQRLSSSQQYLPLSLEMAQIERRALQEAEHEIQERSLPTEAQ